MPVIGFFSNLASSAGGTLGTNLMGGHKVKVKSDVKGETKIANAVAKAQIKQADAQAKRETQQVSLEIINGIRFDGSSDDISENLSKLLSMYKQFGDNSFKGMLGLKSDSDRVKEAIREKLEFGLLKLRKVDEDMANYFQEKVDVL